MLLVTGGAGFIGSNVVANLNERGRTDIAISDRLETGSKWRNLQKRQLADVIAPGDLEKWLAGRKLDAVIHLGAISDTTYAVLLSRYGETMITMLLGELAAGAFGRWLRGAPRPSGG